MTIQAFRAAGDPKIFPEQIAEGLRAWQPLKVYIGGVRDNEEWHVRVDPGQFSPWLGMSYSDFARVGLSFQRSQNSGRLSLAPGPQVAYYKRVDTVLEGASNRGGHEDSFFAGVDTSLGALFKTLRRPEPAGAQAKLQAIAQAVDEAISRFSMSDPSASVPALARGLAATRSAIDAFASEPDAVFLLRRKEAQFVDAINTAMGVSLTAVAQPSNTPEPTGAAAAFAPPPMLSAVVPGQQFDIQTTFVSRGEPAIVLRGIRLDVGSGWKVSVGPEAAPAPAKNEPVKRRFTVTLAADVPISSKPYFERASFQDARYLKSDASQFGSPASTPPAVSVVSYSIDGVPIEAREVVQRREARLPYGYVMRELRVVPAIAVTSNPSTVVVPVKAQTKRVSVSVDVLNNRETGCKGQVALQLPQGWSAEPASAPFAFARAGERATYTFTVAIPSIADREYAIAAVATADGKEYREGYETIEYRDLEARQLYRPSMTAVRGVDVEIVPGLDIGYVMGIGDQVPNGIRQLGYNVTLLDENELARGNLSRFDAIVTGTRAYAVRDDLKTYSRRLLDYVEQGGNMIVLYNTQELMPDQWAPKPGELTARAEEVSEEDSPVDILAPDAPMLNFPNKITKADFAGWVEQRGSKFWSKWDPEYRPIIATWDRGQAPQAGGWLWTKYGKGNYTYFAYAMHRQLPYGVPGAYRLMANLLALGKNKGPV
jgi:hypothetical protein